MKKATDKPPYCVPTMDEVRAIPWNGLKVASTFSGAGGSCLGYRMAGYRVVWANEFVPSAQESYRANASEHCYLDCRDVATVQADEVLEQCGLEPGELDLFDGSPPCQAFSTAGQRDKGWGKAKSYEHGAKQQNETLFDHYIRLLRGIQPRVFVAENVTGLIKGKAKGFFLEILRDLKASGYRVVCRVLDAKWLGVPQSRQRTFFVGVREDLDLEPVHPSPLPYLYSMRDALPELVSGTIPATVDSNFRIRRYDGCSSKTSGYQKGDVLRTDRPSPAIIASRSWDKPREGERLTIAEVKRLCSFPDDFVLTGSYSQQWARLGNSVPPLMMRAQAEILCDNVLRCSPSEDPNAASTCTG